MTRGVSRCPNCGEPVSPFAAGCAICGTDLEVARRRQASKRGVELPRPSFSIRPGSNGFQVAIAFLLALFVSPIGLLLDIYWGYQHRNRGDTTMAALMFAAAALAAVAMVAPVWFWRHIY